MLEKDLEKFGLSEEEVRIYIHLLSKPRSTPLMLSKRLKMARTKVYRNLEKLLQGGLVREEVLGYGKKFFAEDPSMLYKLIQEKERDVLLLKSSASSLVRQLEAMRPILDQDTKIIHYRGLEGLKQMAWNSTKVNDKIFRIYEKSNSMETFLEKDFSEKMRREFMANNPKLEIHQLTNMTSLKGDTNVDEMIKNWYSSYIPSETLDIKIEVRIYNDVYCMCDYQDDDVFIVEIVNEKLAQMQKQIFDLIWNSAKPLRKLDERGNAELL